jgi:hypothetical protein
MGLNDRLRDFNDAAVGHQILLKLAAELERRGITAEEIGRLSRISMWQGLTKNEEGEAEIHDLYGFQLAPSWDDGPDWPVVQQAAPVKVSPVKTRGERRPGSVTVILPDPQIGFRRLHDGEMIATHDEAAIDVALQITKAIQPDKIVNLGDTLDFPEWSTKFLVKPEFVLTTQPTIDYAHKFLALQRSIAPNAEIVLLGGNHDVRMGNVIAKNAMAALRLRQANVPDSWPILSIPFLLRLDELTVTYVGAYPAGRFQITQGGGGVTPLWAVHGEKLDVAKVARSERQSFVQGHIHRIALHTEQYEINGEPETVVAFSPGCLCRVDGAVPSTKSGDDEFGRPVQRWENWSQGLAVVTEEEDGFWTSELIPIHRGRAHYRGKTYEAGNGVA